VKSPLALSPATGSRQQLPGIVKVSGCRRVPCQYKDKWPRNLAPQRGGSPPTGDRYADTRSECRKQYSNAVIPKHVQQCANSGARNWWIYTWARENPGLVTRIPYVCNSWRCPWCRRHEGAVAFARIKEGFERIEGYDPQRVAFFVLTIDRNGYYSGQPWASVGEAYRQISTNARKFIKRLNRLAKKQGVEPVGSRWVGTVEAHKTGWPHYQLLLYLPREWAEQLPKRSKDHRSGGRLAQELRAMAEATGWGRRSTFEAARSGEAAMGYLIKTAGSHDSHVGEVAKLTQLPLNAPQKFRRLRAGKKFLPPRRKNPETTGTLLRRMWCEDGTPMVTTLHEIADPVARVNSSQCCYEEERIWARESDPMLLAARQVWPDLARELTPLVSQMHIGKG